MAAIYDVTEFCTAVKPWLLELIVTSTGRAATYLDPDIRVFAPLDGLAVTVPSEGFTVTPHSVRPMPRDGKSPSEVDILLSGAYNLGFLTVGPQSLPFLRWWQQRLRWDCLHDVRSGYFVDQRWMDLAVHYFPAVVDRDEALNVAYWNLDSRRLARHADQWTVNGEPLRFFHFSGYRPSSPEVLFRYALAESRVDPRTDPLLQVLLAEYADELHAQDYLGLSAIPYRFERSAGGVPLTLELRRKMRQFALENPSRAFPDPFDPTMVDAFDQWLRIHYKHPLWRRAVRTLPPPAQSMLRRARDMTRRGLDG